MIQYAIKRVMDGQNLSIDEAVSAMSTIMSGEATPAQIAGLLIGLRMKGETVDEIAGFAQVMRAKAIKVAPVSNSLVDTCGTGGDFVKTFNISTCAAFIAAGAGVKIAKHGNRAMSSKCGSADILEALGVNINLSPDKVADCIDKIGIGFMFAQAHHPAMKYAGPVRRELGVRTVFNVLGPLTNPASANAQIIGTFEPSLTEVLAGVLGKIGTRRAMVFHGLCGMDEISTLGDTKISELKDGEVRTYCINPADFGIPVAQIEEIAGGDIEYNTRILLDILKGKPGAARDIAVLNSAAALYVSGIAANMVEGVKLAGESIDSGAAFNKLEQLGRISCDS